MSKKAVTWGSWIALALMLSSFLGWQLFAEDQKSDFLIGEVSHGHHQIEMQCTACHVSAFGGDDVIQDACVNCHADELKMSQDSHPKTKFNDPRNIDTLEIIDARYCGSCHIEHNPDKTHAMGVTLPEDFCFHCHQDIAQERPSHEGMGFETCASAGCHNFHDNRALYEDFLIKHANTPWLKDTPVVADAQTKAYVATLFTPDESLQAPSTPELDPEKHAEVATQFSLSSHLEAGLTCNSCHGSAEAWIAKPDETSCASCHDFEVAGFKAGKHGMRIAHGLDPMQPALASEKLAFHASAADTQLTCNTCHGVHETNVVEAAVDACLSCHDDEHSQQFMGSPHGGLWQSFTAGQLPRNEAIACSTCHMPKTTHERFGEEHVLVQHNQNENLRPNEKMIRSVCLDCHGLPFVIDALASPALIKSNFSGKPDIHVESVDMALEREKPRK